MTVLGEEVLGLHWPTAAKDEFAEWNVNFCIKAATDYSIHSSDQRGRTRSQQLLLWLFSPAALAFWKSRGTKTGLIACAVEPARTVSKHQPQQSIATAKGTAVLMPAIKVVGISWGRKGKDKSKEWATTRQPHLRPQHSHLLSLEPNDRVIQ